jgi:hypothetical protein
MLREAAIVEHRARSKAIDSNFWAGPLSALEYELNHTTRLKSGAI